MTYLRRVKRDTPTSLLPLPDLQQSRGKNLLASFTPRRSTRLAVKAKQRTPAITKTHRLLTDALGMNASDGVVSLAKLQTAFDNQLSSDQIAALAALVKMAIPASLPTVSINLIALLSAPCLVSAC